MAIKSAFPKSKNHPLSNFVKASKKTLSGLKAGVFALIRIYDFIKEQLLFVKVQRVYLPPATSECTAAEGLQISFRYRLLR